MVQLRTNHAKLDIVLEDILDDLLRISDLEGEDEMRMLLLKITDKPGRIYSPGMVLAPKNSSPRIP